MLLDKTIIALCKVATKDDGRPVLASVKFEGGKYGIATDGYRLLRLELPQEENQVVPSMGYQLTDEIDALIPAKALESALKLIPKKVSLPILQYAWSAKGQTDASVRIVSSNLDTTIASEIKLTEGEFPTYEKILHPEGQKEAKAVTNVRIDLMIETLEAMKLAGVDQFRIEIREPLDPIHIKAKGVNNRTVEAVLMPIRTYDE